MHERDDPHPDRDGAEPPIHGPVLAILVTGIVSITIMPVLGPVAWALGRTALREIDAEPSRYTNRSTVEVGMVLGIVATVFLIVGLRAGRHDHRLGHDRRWPEAL